MVSRIERIGDATLYLGDCREIMPRLGRVAALVTDPPYGNSNHDGDYNSRLNLHRNIEGQPIANDDEASMREAVDSMLSLVVPLLDKEASACCCFCGGGGPRPVFAWLAERMDRGGLEFFHSVIWDKRNPGLGQRYRRQHEMIMVAHKAGGRIRWNKDGRLVRNVLSEMPSREREHPNEKPLALMAQIVGAHSNAPDRILDPFMGSGTTGVAALRLGRKFTGIEIEERWFDIACRRIEAEARQGRLAFDETADAIGSYNDAVAAVGERVKAGSPIPDFFLPEAAE
jgi:site-specific DNA-methyltransferase (adenine-specific)